MRKNLNNQDIQRIGDVEAKMEALIKKGCRGLRMEFETLMENMRKSLNIQGMPSYTLHPAPYTLFHPTPYPLFFQVQVFPLIHIMWGG